MRACWLCGGEKLSVQDTKAGPVDDRRQTSIPGFSGVHRGASLMCLGSTVEVVYIINS